MASFADENTASRYEAGLNRSSELYSEGRNLIGSGELERAVEVLRASIEAHPHFKTLELLGECLLNLGRAEQAIVPLAAASALNRQVRAPSLLAQAFAACGEFRRAAEVASAVLAAAPTNKVARRVLAVPEVARFANDPENA